MDARLSETKDLPALARERVRIGPAPEWISACAYDAEFKANLRGPVTELFRELQVHAELRQTYVRTALRLETMQAVQHHSQWRLEFEPQTQSLTLHSIKIRRGSVETEHVSLSRMQFLQRESGLEGHLIDGWITLLLLLEDVQPGDILEWSYTLESRPRLLPDNTALIFSLPAGVEIGKYHFSVRHAEARPLRWKSSSPDLAPTISREGEHVRCFWLGDRLISPEPEACTPDWTRDYPWIQVSDFPDWQSIVRGLVAAWNEQVAGDGLEKLIEEVKNQGPDLLTRVRAAVELVQDRFRYLSVNLELGGQIPAAAETVIRRRYGDCKDLAFLLVQLLRGLGVSARPVLVNAMSRQAVGTMLPAPGIFNHAVVEYEVGNQKRWVDVTAKSQGGGALNRQITNFGLGLPLDENTTNLAPVPTASLASGTCEVKESFLLDTTGKPSSLAIVVVARGSYAEMLRFQFDNTGLDVIAKDRAQACANRFFKATRAGPLETRDDRELNEFVIAEVFEIEGFLKDNGYDACLFQIQSDATADLLCPSAAPRRNPFALPFPCHRVHIVEIEFTGTEAISIPHYQAGAEFFSFSRRCKSLHNFLKLTFSFNTAAESVPAAKLPAHRLVVEEVWRESAIQIRLPTGYARLRKRNDFGALPTPTRTASNLVRIAPATSAPVVTTVPATVATVPAPAALETNPKAAAQAAPAIQKAVEPARSEFVDPAEGTRRRRSSRSSRRSGRSAFDLPSGKTNRKSVWSFFILLGAIAALVLGVILAKTAGLEGFGGAIILVVIPAWIWSMGLAAVGLGQCLRRPERYPHGKTLAILTLVFGACIGLLLTPGMIGGIKGAMAGARSRNGLGFNKRDTFKDFNFVLNAPGAAWRQVEEHKSALGLSLVFAHASTPMIFTVGVQRLEPGLLEPRRHVMEKCREAYQREATSYSLISEGEVIRNGLAGWQAETRGIIQGRELYHVRWMLATNGFGYQLVLFGPTAAAAQIKAEAERLFSNFESTQP